MWQLLPSEPRIADPKRAHALTAQYLQPALAELEMFFLTVRAEIDPVLRTAAPIKNGKPYPLGQCLEISLAVEQRLKAVDPAALSGPAQVVHQAWSAFLAAGGTMRRIWGDFNASTDVGARAYRQSPSGQCGRCLCHHTKIQSQAQ